MNTFSSQIPSKSQSNQANSFIHQQCQPFQTLIEQNPLFSKTIQQIAHCCRQNNVDNSHGVQHAKDIARHVYQAIISHNQNNPNKLTQIQTENCLLAALLHDVDDRKYFKTQNYQNAHDIVEKVLLNKDQIQRQNHSQTQLGSLSGAQRVKQVLFMVSLVSFSVNGNKIDPQHPPFYYFTRYADRVDAIGMKGLQRCYEYAQRIKNPFYTPKTIQPKSREELQEAIKGRQVEYMQRGGKSTSVIDHIFDKLLHIKLPKEIPNPYLGELYQKGREQIIDFVLQQVVSSYENAEQALITLVEKYNARC